MQRAKKGTRQHEMEEFLPAIVQGKSSVWSVEFKGSSITLDNEVKVKVELTLRSTRVTLGKTSSTNLDWPTYPHWLSSALLYGMTITKIF